MSKPNIPKTFSDELSDLLMKLLMKNPDIRLGRQGSEQVMNHPWFQSINFDLLSKKKVEAPFKPMLGSAEDVSYFDKMFTNLPIASSSKEDHNLYSYSPDFSYYADFSYDNHKKSLESNNSQNLMQV